MAFGDKFFIYVDDVKPDLVLSESNNLLNDVSGDWTGLSSFSPTSIKIDLVDPTSNVTATRDSFTLPQGRNRLKAVVGTIITSTAGTITISVKRDSDSLLLGSVDFTNADAAGTVEVDIIDTIASTLVFIDFNVTAIIGSPTSSYEVTSILVDNQPDDHQFRITIQQDGYVGGTSDLTSAGFNPVLLTWKGEEDVYKPLLGSECTLNLFDTTGSELDEFFTAGEKEYIVLVEWFDGIEYFVYWKGYIVPGRYIQFITSPPYVVSLRAVDDLHLLNTSVLTLPTETKTDVYDIIENCLDNTILGGDFLTYAGMNADYVTGRPDNFFSQISLDSIAYYNLDGTAKNCLKIMESILYDGNFKIQQRFGRWYILNNASVNDSSVSFLDGADVATGVSFGKTVPADYQPIFDDLTREVDRGFLRTKKLTNLEQRPAVFDNPNFETLASFSPWTDTFTLLTIDTTVFLSGDQSVFFDTASIENGGSASDIITANTSIDTFDAGEDFTFSFAYYINEVVAGEYKIRYQLRLFNGVDPDLFWDTDTNEFLGATFTIEVATTVTQQWQRISLPNITITPFDDYDLQVRIMRVNAPSAIDVKLNIDDFLVYRRGNILGVDYKFAQLETVQTTGDITAEIDQVEVFQGDAGTANISFPGTYRMNDAGDSLLIVERIGLSEQKIYSELAEEQRILDYELFNKRYDGTFYNVVNPWIPFTPLDIFIVDFVALSETKKSAIDYMKFNLKQNTYEVRTHSVGFTTNAVITQVLTYFINKPT